MADCRYDVLVRLLRCNGSNTFQKGPPNIFPEVLRINGMFSDKCEMGFCFLLGQQWFWSCISPIEATSLFHIVGSWPLTSTGAVRPTEFQMFFWVLLYLLDELMMSSWSSSGWSASRRTFPTVPCVNHGSDWGSLESQNRRDGSVTLSRLMYVGEFIL